MEIIKREEKRGILDVRARGNKIALRGLYYWSPWIRDLQACPKLREMFCQIAGEELVPHPSFSNSPQVIIIQLISLYKDFTKIYHSKGLDSKNKGPTNFNECCVLTKKYI